MIPAPGGGETVGTLRDGGRETAFLLVHGILGSRRMDELEVLGERLALRHDVLSIDVHGHGDGPGRFTWGRDEWRQVVASAAWLADPGRRVCGIGFSFGGYHVARAAARGAAFDRVVLVGAPCDLRVFDHFPLSRALWRHLPAMLRRRRRLPRCERLPLRGERALREDELRKIAVPALVVHGGADWLVTRRHAERFVAAIPDARFVEIEGGLHAEYLVDSHPEELVRALDSFFAVPGC